MNPEVADAEGTYERFPQFDILKNLQGEHKKVAPTTFVDISAMREDFCMRFYATVKQSNIHFVTKFG